MIRFTSCETGNPHTTFTEIVNFDERILNAAKEYAAEHKITYQYEIHKIAAQFTGCLNRINLCVRDAMAKGEKEVRVSFNFTHSKYLDVCQKLAANIFNYTISHRDWTEHFEGTAFSDIDGFYEVPTRFEVTWPENQKIEAPPHEPFLDLSERRRMTADVEFICNGVGFPADRKTLKMRCTELKQIPNKIDINADKMGYTEQHLRDFVDFLYTDTINLRYRPSDAVDKLQSLARTYGVPGLDRACTHVLAGRHHHPLFPKPIEWYLDGKLEKLPKL